MNGGPNQHYIPRFLQRAFGIPKKRREIWRFALNKSPERSLIKRTGSDDYFYSHPAVGPQPTLDDTITRIESNLSQTLWDVRTGSMEEPIDSSKAAAVVSHMFSRTANIRSTLRDGYTLLLERIRAGLAHPANVERMLGLDSDSPTQRFREQVMSELARRPELAGLDISQHELERVAFVALKENSPALLTQSAELLSVVIDEVLSRLGDLVRDGHNEALDQAVKSSEYESLLRKFEWAVESAPRSGAILPDCVVIAFGEDRNASTPLFVGGEALRAVVMAVSPERLLVGRRLEFELPVDFEYNVEAASLSRSYFLSPRNDLETSRLHARIGGKFRCMLDEVIEAALFELL